MYIFKSNADRFLQNRKGEFKMNRVMVIGCPGSGKTTFAEELNKRTGLPLY